MMACPQGGGGRTIENSLIYRQLMEGVGHRRDPLCGQWRECCTLLASLDGATSRARYEQANGKTR